VAPCCVCARARARVQLPLSSVTLARFVPSTASPRGPQSTRWSSSSIELLHSTSASTSSLSSSSSASAAFTESGYPQIVSPTCVDVRSSRVDADFTPLSPADGAAWRVGFEWLGVPVASASDCSVGICIKWSPGRAGRSASGIPHSASPFSSVVQCMAHADDAVTIPLTQRWLSDFVPAPPHLTMCDFGSRYSPIRVHLPHGAGVVMFHVPLPLQPSSPLAAADPRSRVGAASTMLEVKIAVVQVLAQCLASHDGALVGGVVAAAATATAADAASGVGVGVGSRQSSVVDVVSTVLEADGMDRGAVGSTPAGGPSQPSSPGRLVREMSFTGAADVLVPTAACLPLTLCGVEGAADGSTVAELKRIVEAGPDRCVPSLVPHTATVASGRLCNCHGHGHCH
jgi:hypothetical protein